MKLLNLFKSRSIKEIEEGLIHQIQYYEHQAEEIKDSWLHMDGVLYDDPSLDNKEDVMAVRHIEGIVFGLKLALNLVQNRI